MTQRPLSAVRCLVSYYIAMALGAATACSSGTAGEGGGLGAACTESEECPAGAVCFELFCRALCEGADGCANDEVCADTVCLPSGEGAPIITRIDGDSPLTDPASGHAEHHVERRVHVFGANLERATASLQLGDDPALDLDVCSASAGELVLALPADVQPGAYALRVVNQAGACTSALDVLQGVDGSSGPSGAPGVPCVGCVDSATLSPTVFAGTGSADTVAHSDHEHANGVVYTRWGRTTCPGSASLVYAGIMVGKHQTHGGGGSNPLCAAQTPEWLDFDSGNQNGNLLYGAEYQTGGRSLVDTRWSTLHDDQVPCAVCYVPERGVSLLAAARHTCPAGWTEEYDGYLMGMEYQQGAGDSFCVDRDAEASPFGGGTGDENGFLLYFTEAECGSLPCLPGPYVQDRELTCAVCTL